jgi:hypothetical protein
LKSLASNIGIGLRQTPKTKQDTTEISVGYFDTANEQTRMKGVRIVDAGGVDVSLGAELHSELNSACGTGSQGSTTQKHWVQ